MRSPFALPSNALIYLIYHCLRLASAQEIHLPPVRLTPPPIQYSPNPFLVLSRPVCPASGVPRAPDPSHFPWDEAPTCLRVISETGEHTYCVHATTSFANGRGISIVTSPSIGASIADSPALQFPNLTPESPLYPSSRPISPSFEVKEVPGRGKGLVANRTISFGEVISYNTPLLIVDRRFFDAEGGLQKDQRLFLLREAVSKLPKPSQALFFEQCTRESGMEPSLGSSNLEAQIENILKTNSYTGYFSPAATSSSSSTEAEAEARTHGLNIPESSRLNHDCRPNTAFIFDPLTLTHKIHAVATIRPGEEITTSYISPLDTFETRQAALLKHWGFHCSCALCTGAAEERAQSDARLTLIQRYREYLMDWSYESLGTPELALQYIGLLEAERLHAKVGEAHVIAALRFSAWEKEAEAQAHARRAIKKGLWWDGDEREEMEEMERLALAGRTHWSWGLARKLRIGQDGTVPVDRHVAVAGMRLVKQEAWSV